MNMIGQKIEGFTILGEVYPQHVKSRSKKFFAKCGCGKTVFINKKTSKKSCGCKFNSKRVSHGMSGKKEYYSEYNAWKSMKRRCYLKTCKDYYNYGARGIRVCERWIDSFENFLEDVGKKPSKDHSMDRIDPDGDYSPTNCRWANSLTQSQNRRFLKRYNYKGEMLLISEISRLSGIKSTTIHQRIHQYKWPLERAFGLKD